MDSTFESILASNEIQCPLCSKPDWCLIKADHRGVIFWSLCGRTNEAPAGWERTGTSRDNRGIFRLEGANHNRKIFPKELQLVWREAQDGPAYLPIAIAEGEAPGVGDRAVFAAKGAPPQICTVTQLLGPSKQGGGMRYELISPGGATVFADDRYLQVCRQDPTTGDREVAITYQYGPVHQVRRRQWSDRRPWYQGKNKHVRPWYATERGDGPGMIWQEGRGTDPWPLYHEAEAIEAITTGRTLFVCGGEPAVEALRSLGLYATCNAGGENRWIDLYQTIEPIWRKAREGQRHPIVVIWGDYDVTGESTSAKLLKRLLELGIRAVTIDPPEIWPAIPAKGDAVDWISAHRDQELDWYLAAIKGAVDKAIDRHEVAEVAKRRAKNWGAPFNNKGELGYERLREVKWLEDDHLKKEWKEVYVPVSNFDFRIQRQITGPQGSGYQLAVISTTNTTERTARVWGDHLATAPNFRKQLSAEVGESLICRLKDEEFQALLMVRILEYRQQTGGKQFRLVDRAGKQPDGHWIFPDAQFDKTGAPTTEQRSGWIYDDNLTDQQTAKQGVTGRHDPQAIKTLASAARRFFGANWPIVLLAMGYVAAGCHYNEIIDAEDSFPILNLYGDMGTGKTTSATTALALVGQHKAGMMAKVSVSAAYEKLQCAGGLTHCIDDPTRDENLSEFFKSLYNAKSRVVRGRDGKRFASQTPHSPLFFSSNMALGSDHQAARSRLIKISVPPIEGGDKTAWPDLEAATRSASDCLPDLIRMTYDPTEVKQIEALISPALPLAHDRIPRSFALLLAYAQKVAALIGDETDLIEWCKTNCFPLLNTSEEGGDSLIDFVEKARALEIQGELGPWNMRVIDKLGARCLAINLASAWPLVDRNYKLPYDLGNLRAVIEQRGGNLKGVQKFHCDRVTSIKEGSKTKLATQRCVEIPLQLLEKSDIFFGDSVFGVNDVNEPTEQPSNLDTTSDALVTQCVNQNLKSVNRFTSAEEAEKLSLFSEANSPDLVYTVYTDVTESVTNETLTTEGVQPTKKAVYTVTPKNTNGAKTQKTAKTPKSQNIPGFSVGDRGILVGGPKDQRPREIIEIKDGMARIGSIMGASEWHPIDQIRKVEVPHADAT
jgi:hypothetical protein